jgi:hypothetical protein
MAKRNSTVHTPRGLLLQLIGGELLINFEPVVHALKHGAAVGRFAGIFKKSGWPSQRTTSLLARQLLAQAAS